MVLLRFKGEGDLYEVRVVSDNPYLEVYIELDDYRNENISAAELLAQPQTGRLLSNFQAIDGGSPSQGYTLLYNPDIPEDYQGRIRAVLRNRIKPSKDVFEILLLAMVPTFSWRLGISSQPGYGGGGVIPHSHTAGDGGRLTHIAYTSAAGDYFNNVPGLLNRAFLSPAGIGVPPGALHPYVGSAGIPILNQGNIIVRTPVAPMNNTLHVFFDETADYTANPEQTWPRDTEQSIYIADFSGGALTAGSELVAGARMWFKDKNNIYFPGVIDAVTAGVTLPTKFAANGGSAYTNCLKIDIKPGFAAAPPTMTFNLYDTTLNEPGAGNLNGTAFGTLTTAADTAPPILIYNAEIDA